MPDHFGVSGKFESMYALAGHHAVDDRCCKIVRKTFSSIHLIKYRMELSDFTDCPLKLAPLTLSWSCMLSWTMSSGVQMLQIRNSFRVFSLYVFFIACLIKQLLFTVDLIFDIFLLQIFNCYRIKVIKTSIKRYAK